MTKNNENQNCQYMTRRIGSTTYKVKVAFSDNGGETMEEKILRMIRNEVPSSENLYFAKHFREYQLGKHIIYLPCNLL